MYKSSIETQCFLKTLSHSSAFDRAYRKMLSIIIGLCTKSVNCVVPTVLSRPQMLI
jgi:hypothetical protein